MMNGWHNRLIAVGLVLILGGFLFGFFFSLSVGHQARLVAHDAYQPVFEEITGKGTDDEWRSLEADISETSVAHRRAADVHGHSTNMGILLILVGLLAPLFATGGGGGRLMLGLAISAVVYPAGLLLQFLTFTLAGEIVSALGAVGAVASLAALYLRFRKGIDELTAP